MAKKKKSSTTKKRKRAPSQDALGKMWKGAREAAAELGNFTDVDPGPYLALLTDAGVDVMGDKDWLHVDFEWTIISDGDFLGEKVHHRDGIADEQQLSFTIKDLQRLGVAVDELELNTQEDLEEILKELVKEEVVAKIRVKKQETEKGEFTNVYINKVVDVDPGDIPDYKAAAEARKTGGAAPESGEVEEGAKVSFDVKGETVTGEVRSVDADAGKVKVKRDDTGKIRTMDLDSVKLVGAEEEEEPEEPEEEEEEEEDDEVEKKEEDEAELKEGAKVAFKVNGRDVEGIVREVLADEGKAKVKRNDTGKIRTVAAADLELLEG